MERIFLIFLLVLLSKTTWASSCCGQSSATFPVLFQHQKYNVSPTWGYTESLGRVNSGSQDFFVWSQGKKRTLQTWSVSGAIHVTEQQQFFLSCALQNAQMKEGSSQGESSHLSDTLLGYSYDLVSEYTYSAWKPEVFVSTFMNLPTGHSIYDANQLSEGADVTGHGQWGVGLGLSLRKVWFPFTLLTQFKILRLLPENFNGTEVSGFYDSSASAFATYALPWWEVNVTGGVVWTTLSSRRVSSLSQRSSYSEVSAVTLALQKNINDDWGVSVSASDQSLIGRPQNTLLNRTYSISFNYNYF